MALKSRTELDSEVGHLVIGKDRVKVQAFLLRHFKVKEFHRLDLEEYNRCLELLKDAIYKGFI